MPKSNKEYFVEVKISGRATVLTEAASADEAIDKVNRGEFWNGEIIEWSAEDVVAAEVNE